MPAYLDVDDLLCGYDEVPVTVRGDLPGMGALDPRQATNDLPAKSEVSLPLWLVEATQMHHIFSVRIPGPLSEKSLHQMQLDPAAWDPRLLSPDQFRTLARMCRIFGQRHQQERRRCETVLREVLRRRLGAEAVLRRYPTEQTRKRQSELLKEIYDEFMTCLIQ